MRMMRMMMMMIFIIIIIIIIIIICDIYDHDDDDDNDEQHHEDYDNDDTDLWWWWWWWLWWWWLVQLTTLYYFHCIFNLHNLLGDDSLWFFTEPLQAEPSPQIRQVPAVSMPFVWTENGCLLMEEIRRGPQEECIKTLVHHGRIMKDLPIHLSTVYMCIIRKITDV